MSATLDFFYDLGSPYSYLAATQLAGIRQRTGGEVRHLPITLGGVRKQLGTTMPSVAQLQYMSNDIGRWARKYGVPMAIPSAFPTKTIAALLRACVAAGLEGKGEPAMHALFAAYWAHDQDISDLAVIEKALSGAGLDGARLVKRTEEDEIKEGLRRNTELALDRGVFGVPMMFVGERSFWGNDRLRRFAGSRPARRCTNKSTPSTNSRRPAMSSIKPDPRSAEEVSQRDHAAASCEEKARFLGTLAGLAVGESLGAPYENKKAGTFTPVKEIVGGGQWEAGEPTDDVELTLALMRVVARGSLDLNGVAQGYLKWFNNKPKDVGNLTKSALLEPARRASRPPSRARWRGKIPTGRRRETAA